MEKPTKMMREAKKMSARAYTHSTHIESERTIDGMPAETLFGKHKDFPSINQILK